MDRRVAEPQVIRVDADSFNRLLLAGIPTRAVLRLARLKARGLDEQDSVDARWHFVRWLARSGRIAG